MLIIGPSGSGKTNLLLHLIDKLHPIDKIYLYAKDLSEPKYEYLINKREQVGIKMLQNAKAFIEYSDDSMYLKTLTTTTKSVTKNAPSY